MYYDDINNRFNCSRARIYQPPRLVFEDKNRGCECTSLEWCMLSICTCLVFTAYSSGWNIFNFSRERGSMYIYIPIIIWSKQNWIVSEMCKKKKFFPCNQLEQKLIYIRRNFNYPHSVVKESNLWYIR